MSYCRIKPMAVVLTGLMLLQANAVRAQQPPLPVGSKAPDFVTRTLTGKPLSLKSMRGQVVLIDFWATWCVPCRMATPTLERLQRRFGRNGLKIVGLSLDASDSRDEIRPYKRKYRITYTLAYDPGPNF